VNVQIPFARFRLDNGLDVIVHEDHRLPLVAVNLWYQVGSGHEVPGPTGFAHLFEHLMFEGSAHVAPGQFDLLLEGVGGSNNGSTSTDRTNYWMNVPAGALDLALWLE
jgi:zinc protease